MATKTAAVHEVEIAAVAMGWETVTDEATAGMMGRVRAVELMEGERVLVEPLVVGGDEGGGGEGKGENGGVFGG